MIRWLQRYLDAEYARGYQAGLADGLDEADRRRAAALEKVWQVIDEPTVTGASPDDGHSNVVAIHLRRADGKWHL